ncbi:MAG: ASCH domain-containing protein [Phormidesmis sp.]
MTVKILLLSIRPKYASKIFEGIKDVELRRTRPRLIRGDLVIVYASSPTKALVGVFEVREVIQKPLMELWNDVKGRACVSYNEFRTYYKGLSIGCGIILTKTHYFEKPVELDCLRKEWDNFRPPQSYRYLKPNEIELVQDIAEFDIGEISNSYQIPLNIIA